MTIPYGRQEITDADMATNSTDCLIDDYDSDAFSLFFKWSPNILAELIRNTTMNQDLL